MLEFIEIELVKGLLFLLMTASVTSLSFRANTEKQKIQHEDDSKNNEKFYWLLFIGILIVIPFIDAKFSMSKAEQNIQNFKAAKILRCTKKDTKYRVSRKDGWEIDGLYFVKDSLMIRADICEVN